MTRVAADDVDIMFLGMRMPDLDAGSLWAACFRKSGSSRGSKDRDFLPPDAPRSDMRAGRVAIGVGSLLFLLGLVLSIAPVYLPVASSGPRFVGTMWYAGVPVLIAGAALVMWGWRRGRTRALAE